MNDLPQVLEKCNIHMYADDTVIYYSASTTGECEEMVSEDMKRAANWFTENRLSLHPDKTKSMLFGLPQKLRHVKDATELQQDKNTATEQAAEPCCQNHHRQNVAGPSTY
ncbi:hypothetical protein Bbelb_062080 [Branchiostoma belcheri]|nr:hypothetical protein Bbelb_062080 [Branchiostoma belcheri]